MLKILKIILLTVLFISPFEVKSQTATGSTQTLLWKISGNGLNKDSYILLTTANACIDMPALNSKTLSALENVHAIAVESGFSDPANEAALQKLVTVKTENQSVKKVLSPGLYNQLAGQAAKVGLNEVRLNTYKPIFICALTIQVVAPCQLQKPKNEESLLRSYAKDKNIKVSELLSLTEAFDTLDAYPNDYWEKILNYLINNSAQAATDLDTKTNFYTYENLRGLSAILNKSDLFRLRYSYPDVEMKRISLLGSKIQDMIKNQSSLVLIDASAVANPNTSIFRLLTKSGYVISPIVN